MVFAVQGEGGGEASGLVLPPAGQDVGQGVEVQGDLEVTQDGVRRGGIELRSFLGPEAEGFALGLGRAPPADPKLRTELEATSLADLLRELEQRDPATFARIDRQNPRRVLRAASELEFGIRLRPKPCPRRFAPPD